MKKEFLEYKKPEIKIVFFETNIKTLSYASPGSKEDTVNWDDIFGNGHG